MTKREKTERHSPPLPTQAHDRRCDQALPPTASASSSFCHLFLAPRKMLSPIPQSQVLEPDPRPHAHSKTSWVTTVITRSIQTMPQMMCVFSCLLSLQSRSSYLPILQMRKKNYHCLYFGSSPETALTIIITLQMINGGSNRSCAHSHTEEPKTLY